MQDPELTPGRGQHPRPAGAARGRRGDMLPPAPPAPAWLARLGDAIDWVVVVIGASMIVLVFFNVLMHIVGRDLAWVTELAELLMVWVTFLGGACATRRGAQMTITEFIDKLAGNARRAADLAVDAFAIVILSMLVWYGMRLVVAGWSNELTVLQIPMSFQYLGMPVGCAAMLVFLVWDVVRLSRGDTREERWPS
jgi:TRAP-type C4-dicarboxylate transport system permease small subunit